MPPAMRQGRPRRPVHGVLLLDKPAGISSNVALRTAQRLYRVARAGVDVPRAPRAVVISAISLLAMAGDELDLAVTCSKGTYIRVLAEDIGRALGCGACLSALRRTAAGGFSLESGTYTLARLEAMSAEQRDAALLPPDALLASLPPFDLDA